MYYEVMSHVEDKVVGTIRWDGRKMVFSHGLAGIHGQLKGQVLMGKTYSDGEDFFHLLPHAFKSGYISLRRREDDED